MNDVVNDSAARLDALTRLWHAEIPISGNMGIRALSYDGLQLTASAPLSENYNVHGTAFAGSQYAITSLAGWGLTYLLLEDGDINGSIVIADGNIQYAKPVAVDLDIVVRADEGDRDAFYADLKSRGKGRLTLTADVRLPDGEIASTFSGLYAVKALD